MRFSPPTRWNIAAGICILALSLAGFAQRSTTFASTQESSVRAHHTHLRHTTATPHTTRSAGLHRGSSRHTRYNRASSRRHPVSLGQRAMDPQRATEIQQALIQAHYLNSSPTGQWDPDSQAAMQKYQTDNGWQSKIMPDSRAIIKLGLGPKQDEGEYSDNPSTASGVSKLSNAAPADSIRTMATSEMPATTQN